MCNGGGGGGGEDLVVWSYTLQYVFEQIPNLQNCFTTPNKNLRGDGGLRQRNTSRKVPFLDNFSEKTTFRFGVFIDIRSILTFVTSTITA